MTMAQVSGVTADAYKVHRNPRELMNINKRAKADLRMWEVEAKWLHKGPEGSEQSKKV